MDLKYAVVGIERGPENAAIAPAARARIAETGIGKLRFARVDSLAPGHSHDFRIHGPGSLVEHDNTQDGASHIHAIWIDPQGRFGPGLLTGHRRNSRDRERRS